MLPEYQQDNLTSHCDLFSADMDISTATRCSWNIRSDTFCQQDASWCYAETICETNSCIKDGQCGLLPYFE